MGFDVIPPCQQMGRLQVSAEYIPAFPIPSTVGSDDSLHIASWWQKYRKRHVLRRLQCTSVQIVFIFFTI